MNEKIKLLAEQAAKKHGHTIKFSPEITETLDSFAELIVRECAEYAEHDLDMAGYKKKFMLKHFGVEE